MDFDVEEYYHIQSPTLSLAWLMSSNETKKKALDKVCPWPKRLHFGSKQPSMALLQLWTQIVHAAAKYERS